MVKKITDPVIYRQSDAIIKQLFGSGAEFRDGQYEAIESTMKHKRVLVVQRTGWGKSLVYFVCTKLMRQKGKGVTLVVSPLLVLMKNQIDAAAKLGLKCEVINSTVRERKDEILASLERNELDLVLVTPESLFSEEVQKRIKNIKIGLFVIDEAHCISDWGHDFRLDYSNLKRVVSALPNEVPVLATTATANDRVISDLETQLGGNVYVSRGPLTRESLAIQVLKMPDKITRYAWILENVKKLDGSGIIYCLTKRDCDRLSEFLKHNGISAEAYYAKEGREELNREIEEKFQNNEIKAIVATVKLGMGYDKGDIAFVIHFQMPKNIVSYYQQIGRAGRSIPRAYTFLMCGKEDVDILNHFIKNAFPTETEAVGVMNFISNNGGVKQKQINSALNITGSRIEKALNFLIHDGFVMPIKENNTTVYYPTPKPFRYDRERYNAITAMRIEETEQMKRIATTNMCYSRFVVESLDDIYAHDCGRCSNCLGRGILSPYPSSASIHVAEEYINNLFLKILPRSRWTHKGYTGTTVIPFPNKEGICLSKYGDPGYGEMVKRDKYSGGNRFCDELLLKSAELLYPLIEENVIQYITCVPSLRSDIVMDFTKRLAKILNLSFLDVLEKNDARQQKEMQNSPHQCANAFNSYSLKNGETVPEKIILVDDMVDSRWTLTVCGYRLSEGGCREIYPFALADSSQEDV